MGSTEEITKLRSVKKKLEYDESDDSNEKSKSKDALESVSPDPLEHGIDDDLKPLPDSEGKEGGASDVDSESEGACAMKPREDSASAGIDVQGAGRSRVDSESSSESGKSPSSEHTKR